MFEGTGKTATVRSVIAELKEEQSKGDVPEFQFLELNGMELISPFDAYPMFWEALSGIKKESLAVGGSAACIDSYFCEDSEDYGDYEGEIARKPVTVLLLDEIDYLVTSEKRFTLLSRYSSSTHCSFILFVRARNRVVQFF
jgi:origin recognition complex subunit 1